MKRQPTLRCSNAHLAWADTSSNKGSRPFVEEAGAHSPMNGTNRRVCSAQSGFMLIEVMVAATLLAVGVTAAMHAIYRSLDASKESQMYTRALFLAQRAMSEVENEVSFNDRYDIRTGWQSFDDSPTYEWRASVSEEDDFWVRRIIVTVRWAKNVNDLYNDEKNYYYRLVTEVPMPRYPEDYER